MHRNTSYAGTGEYGRSYHHARISVVSKDDRFLIRNEALPNNGFVRFGF